MDTGVCFSAIPGHVHLAPNSLKLDAFVDPIKTLEDAVSKSFLVKPHVPRCWIVVFIGALRFATVVPVHHAEHVAFIGVNVGR